MASDSSHTLVIDNTERSKRNPLIGGTSLRDGTGQAFSSQMLWGWPPTTNIALTCRAKESGELVTSEVISQSWLGGDTATVNNALRDILEKSTFIEDGKHLSPSAIHSKFDTGTQFSTRHPPARLTLEATTMQGGQTIGVLDALCASPEVAQALQKNTSRAK